MSKEKVSGKEIISVMTLYLLGSSMVIGGSITAKQDSWISLLIAMIAAIPAIFIYARLSKIAPEKNFFDLSYIAFGKFGGAVSTILFSSFAIHLGTLVMKDLSEFIQVVSMPETPQAINAICFGLIAFYTVKAGIEVLGRGAVFVLPVVILSVLSLSFLSINHMEISNLMPIYNQDLKDIFSGAFDMIVFPFTGIFLFTSVFSSVATNNKPFKLYLSAILLAGFLLFMVMLRNILVLGFPVIESVYFPSYTAASIIDIGEFITRIEVLVSGNFVVTGLVKITICLYAGCRGLAKLFNIDNYKILAGPLTLLMIAISSSLFENTMQVFAAIAVYKYYPPFFQLLLPIILLIFLEIKLRRNKINL